MSTVAAKVEYHYLRDIDSILVFSFSFV